MRARALTAVVVVVVIACGCSAGTETPVESQLVLDFPSTKMAVAMDTVTVQVFDAPDDEACLDLVIKRRTGQTMPAALLDRPPVQICSFLSGKAGKLELTYGRRAFLVVGQRGGQDFTIGCARAGIGDVEQQITVSLTLFARTTPVIETDCVSLSDHCAGKCK
jgi:hypothetical protein